MQSHLTYYLVNTLCLLFPLIFSFHPKLNFYKRWRSFLPACLLTGLFFVAWDVWYTSLGIWSFNPRYVAGAYFINLPWEELVFFFCIPYACVFSYHCLNLFFKNERSRLAKTLTWIFIIGLFFVAAMFPSKIYTSATCLLLGLFLLTLQVLKTGYLYRFYRLYALMLLPFLISNGILTGSFLEEPVVRYNDAYNLGIRLGTIPVEDVFYGMLLILMNVAWYEFFENRQKAATSHEVELKKAGT